MFDTRTSGLGHRRLAATVVLIAVGMVPWIIYLACTLPQQYRAAHWNVLWLGFDIALVAVFVSTALAAWFRRQSVAPLLLVAATLLICDAWFDVVTSFGRPTGWQSIVIAACGEVPVACIFLWLYRRITAYSKRPQEVHCVRHGTTLPRTAGDFGSVSREPGRDQLHRSTDKTAISSMSKMSAAHDDRLSHARSRSISSDPRTASSSVSMAEGACSRS